MSSDFNESGSLAHPQQRPGILQTTLDDKILVYDPEGRTAVTLNETASVIWQLCNGERSVAEIVEILQLAYPEAAATMPHEVDAGVLALLNHRVISLPRLGPSAATYNVEFGKATVRLEADNAEAADILEFLCASMAVPAAGDPSATFRLGAAFTPDAMAIYRDDVMLFRSSAKSSVMESPLGSHLSPAPRHRGARTARRRDTPELPRPDPKHPDLSEPAPGPVGGLALSVLSGRRRRERWWRHVAPAVVTPPRDQTETTANQPVKKNPGAVGEVAGNFFTSCGSLKRAVKIFVTTVDGGRTVKKINVPKGSPIDRRCKCLSKRGKISMGAGKMWNKCEY